MHKDPFVRKQYMLKYQREWIAKRRAGYFADKSCVQCGSTDRMELDHIDRTKKVSHRIWSWSQNKMADELRKCQVLCYECHMAKTIQERTKPLVHGTCNGYYQKRCRCRDCKDWRMLESRRYRSQIHSAYTNYNSRPVENNIVTIDIFIE